MRKPFFSLLILVLFPFAAFCASGAIDTSYSYDYNQPPEFQPSLNNQFTALSNGVADVLVNPAGIMRVATFEVALGLSGFVKNPIRSDENTVYVDDKGMKGTENSPNSRAYIRMTDDRTVVTAEPRPVTIDEDYSKGGGINYFGMTYRISDWLAFSVSRKRPTSASFDYSASSPFMLDAIADFTSTSFEVGGPGNFINIRDDGTMEVVLGGVLVGTSEVAAWSGFLRQGTSEVNWLSGTFSNSITNQNSVIISAAVKTGQFSWGLNVIPMTVDMKLYNEVSVISDSKNSNVKFYIPNLDFASTFEAVNWITHECGLPSGYRSMEVETLAGQQIGSAKVAGNYSGSLTRMDLGMQWLPTDFFSVGAVYENFNGATLNLEGVDVIQYVEHRVDTASQMPTATGESYWNPFLPVPTHEVETERIIRSTLTMQPIELPRNIKFGVALKKPLILALDWEQWQNEYRFSSDPGHPESAHYISFSNISFMRLGMESRLFILPVVMRGSIKGMFKPTTNDKYTEDNLEEMYANTPIYPVDANIYFGLGIFDGEFGFGFGGGGLPLLQAMMLDMSSIAKVFYSNVYFTRGNWQISYLMTMDPVLTGFSSDLSSSPGVDTEIRLMQTSTLSIGFRF